MKYETYKTKDLMNYYGRAGLTAERLANALDANYADCEQIMKFQRTADKCYALNRLYSWVFRQNRRFEDL